MWHNCTAGGLIEPIFSWIGEDKYFSQLARLYQEPPSSMQECIVQCCGVFDGCAVFSLNTKKRVKVVGNFYQRF